MSTDGEYCGTPGQSYVRQWTITNGVVVGPGGDRGTVSIVGDVRLRAIRKQSDEDRRYKSATQWVARQR